MNRSFITSRRGFTLLFGFVLLLRAGSSSVGTSGVAAAQQPPGATNTANQKTAHIRIMGMTCAACAKGLEASFRRMAGVQKAEVDYKTGLAVIVFDPAKQNPASFSAYVVSSGYQVKESKVV